MTNLFTGETAYAGKTVHNKVTAKMQANPNMSYDQAFKEVWGTLSEKEKSDYAAPAAVNLDTQHTRDKQIQDTRGNTGPSLLDAMKRGLDSGKFSVGECVDRLKSIGYSDTEAMTEVYIAFGDRSPVWGACWTDVETGRVPLEKPKDVATELHEKIRKLMQKHKTRSYKAIHDMITGGGAVAVEDYSEAQLAQIAAATQAYYDNAEKK